MSPNSTRFIVFLVLLLHGIGHYMGVVSAMGMKLSKSSSYQSWAFNDPFARILCFILFLVPFFGFIGTALSFQGWVLPHYLWTNLALISAIISMFGLLFFWNALAMLFNKVGAIIVNLFTFITIIWIHWPSELFVEEF